MGILEMIRNTQPVKVNVTEALREWYKEEKNPLFREMMREIFKGKINFEDL